jgi:hypothetical protein
MLTQKRLFEKSVIKTINVFLDSEKSLRSILKVHDRAIKIKITASSWLSLPFVCVHSKLDSAV